MQGPRDVHRLDPEERELAELARRHGIYYRVWPERHVDPQTGEVTQIGFEVDLKGTHDHPARPPLAGCPECVAVYRALRRVAEWALPRGERATRFDVSTFDRKLRPVAGHDAREDVQVTLRILHRQGFEEPVDDCERQCLADLETQLGRIGVRRFTPSI